MLTSIKKAYNLIKNPNKIKLIVQISDNETRLTVINYFKNNLDKYNILLDKIYNNLDFGILDLSYINIVKIIEKISKIHQKFNVDQRNNIILIDSTSVIESITSNPNLHLDKQYIYKYYNLNNNEYYLCGLPYTLNLKLSLINTYTNNYFSIITTKTMALLNLEDCKNSNIELNFFKNINCISLIIKAVLKLD